MKIKTRVTQEVEMDFPLHESEITLARLRGLSDVATRNVCKKYPEADAAVVDFVMHCDAAQRELIPFLSGFVPADQFAARRPVRSDFGACENFVFKWKH